MVKTPHVDPTSTILFMSFTFFFFVVNILLYPLHINVSQMLLIPLFHPFLDLELWGKKKLLLLTLFFFFSYKILLHFNAWPFWFQRFSEDFSDNVKPASYILQNFIIRSCPMERRRKRREEASHLPTVAPPKPTSNPPLMWYKFDEEFNSDVKLPLSMGEYFFLK